MRELQFGDLFAASKIIRKLGIKDDLMSLKVTKETDERQFGLQLAMIIFENMDKAERDVLSFIANIAGENPEDVRQWSMARVVEFFRDLASQEGFADFFQSALTKAEPEK